MPRQHLERELKFDVPDDFEVPKLDRLVSASVEVDIETLTATYYDTDDDHLQRNGITLRRRSGGHDDGWHLKIPTEQARVEIQVESRATIPPREISELVTGVRFGQSMRPRAKLETTRTRHVILDAHGGELAEIADDRVRSTTLGRSAMLDEWREVEVELGPAGDEELLRQLEKELRDCGARPSDHLSKYVRAVGRPPTVERPRRLARLVDDYLQAQRDAIAVGDLRMRRDENAVHKTRVAVRRTRSTLRIFARLFDAERAANLDAELRWYADVLGAVRDLDIVRRRLVNQVDELTPELVLGPVTTTLESWLAQQQTNSWNRVMTTLRGRRYRALLLELDRWRAETPWTDAAQQKKSDVVEYVEKAAKTAKKRLRQAARHHGSSEQFHRARKATKRWRYALELGSPYLGRRARKQVSTLEALQDDLGVIQDAAMSQGMLCRMAAADSAVGESAFTYGLLYAHEEHRAGQVRKSISKSYG